MKSLLSVYFHKWRGTKNKPKRFWELSKEIVCKTNWSHVVTSGHRATKLKLNDYNSVSVSLVKWNTGGRRHKVI